MTSWFSFNTTQNAIPPRRPFFSCVTSQNTCTAVMHKSFDTPHSSLSSRRYFAVECRMLMFSASAAATPIASAKRPKRRANQASPNAGEFQIKSSLEGNLVGLIRQETGVGKIWLVLCRQSRLSRALETEL